MTGYEQKKNKAKLVENDTIVPFIIVHGLFLFSVPGDSEQF